MKPKNTNLINIGHLKDKNEYYAAFQISNMDTEQRKRIIKNKDSPFACKNCKISTKGNKIHVIKYFANVEFEVYASVVEFAKKGVIPERINLMDLEQELDICMLEQEIDISIKLLSESDEELREHGIELRD